MNNRFGVALVLSALFAGSVSRAQPPAADASGLSVEEKVGQLFIVAVDTELAARYEPYIRSGRLGGVSLRWNRFTGPQAAGFTAMLQRWAKNAPAKTPMLIAVDHEGGSSFTERLLGATVFPGNMALGATGSASLARQAATISARELRALGVNVDFAPVLDLNTNPDNPIIGVRSFGEDAAAVSRLGLAALRGYQEGGVAPVVKHFPGHGSTDVDSHLDLPVIHKTLAQLDAVDLVPFKAAIAAQAPLLMPAHIVTPALGADDVPVTLSSAAIEGYLRGRLGFRGVVVSDSLDMGAIANRYGMPQASLMAFQAGCDILLVGKGDFVGSYEKVLQAAKGGTIGPRRLDEAVGRILRLKRELGLGQPTKGLLPAADVGNAGFRRVARRIAERAVTLARDQTGLLPLKLSSRQKLFVLMPRSASFGPAMDGFLAGLKSRHSRTETMTTTLFPDAAQANQAEAAARTADVLVVGSYFWSAPDYKAQAELVERLAALGKPTVLVSLLDPYDLRYFPGATTALCVYGPTPAALEAAADALFGKIKPRGRLPVTIPGFATLGTKVAEH